MPHANKADQLAYRAEWARKKRERIKAENPDLYLKQRVIENERVRLRNAIPENAAYNRANVKEWREANPEKAGEMDADRKKRYAKDYYVKNRDKQIAAAKEWQKNNPERAKEILERSRPVRAYEGYYEFQGSCEACNDPIESRSKAHGDHCHNIGHFRGWLCRKCNLALGHLEDNPDRIKGLLEYVRRDLRRQAKNRK